MAKTENMQHQKRIRAMERRGQAAACNDAY